MEAFISFTAMLLFLVTIYGDPGFNSSLECPNVKEPFKHIRKKRYLGFPTGSNIAIQLQCLKAFVTHIPSGWNMIYELEFLYAMPDEKFIAQSTRLKHHRQKREIWDKIQNVLQVRNMNGKACVIRAICESKFLLGPPGNSLVHDILRALFTAPTHEEEFLQEVGESYSELFDTDFCAQYNDCPISLLDILLKLNRNSY